MRPIEEIMTILHFENAIETVKATTSDHMFNIMQNNNPLYQILQPLQVRQRSAQMNTEDTLIRVKGLYV
jgi:hypothetical protein